MIPDPQLNYELLLLSHPNSFLPHSPHLLCSNPVSSPAILCSFFPTSSQLHLTQLYLQSSFLFILPITSPNLPEFLSHFIPYSCSLLYTLQLTLVLPLPSSTLFPILLLPSFPLLFPPLHVFLPFPTPHLTHQISVI